METLEQKTKRVIDEIDKIIRDNDLLGIICIGGHKPIHIPDQGIGTDIILSHVFIFETSNSNLKATEDGKGLIITDNKKEEHIATFHFFSRAMGYICHRYNQLLDMVEIEDNKRKTEI